MALLILVMPMADDTINTATFCLFPMAALQHHSTAANFAPVRIFDPIPALLVILRLPAVLFIFDLFFFSMGNFLYRYTLQDLDLRLQQVVVYISLNVVKLSSEDFLARDTYEKENAAGTAFFFRLVSVPLGGI